MVTFSTTSRTVLHFSYSLLWNIFFKTGRTSSHLRTYLCKNDYNFNSWSSSFSAMKGIIGIPFYGWYKYEIGLLSTKTTLFSSSLSSIRRSFMYCGFYYGLEDKGVQCWRYNRKDIRLEFGSKILRTTFVYCYSAAVKIPIMKCWDNRFNTSFANGLKFTFIFVAHFTVLDGNLKVPIFLTFYSNFSSLTSSTFSLSILSEFLLITTFSCINIYTWSL